MGEVLLDKKVFRTPDKMKSLLASVLIIAPFAFLSSSCTNPNAEANTKNYEPDTFDLYRVTGREDWRKALEYNFAYDPKNEENNSGNPPKYQPTPLEQALIRKEELNLDDIEEIMTETDENGDTIAITVTFKNGEIKTYMKTDFQSETITQNSDTIAVGDIQVSNMQQMSEQLNIPDNLARYYVDYINDILSRENTDKYRRYRNFVNAVNVVNYFVHQETITPKEGWFIILRILDEQTLQQYPEYDQIALDAIDKDPELKDFYETGNVSLMFQGFNVSNQNDFIHYASLKNAKNNTDRNKAVSDVKKDVKDTDMEDKPPTTETDETDPFADYENVMDDEVEAEKQRLEANIARLEAMDNRIEEQEEELKRLKEKLNKLEGN